MDRDHGSCRRVVADPPQEADACCDRGAAMMIQYGQALGDYLYDVFVAKFDFWLAFGLIAQLFFTARFLVQWISSERAGKSVVPMAFWFFSIGGGMMTLVYGIVKREPVIIIGQALATIIYIRNIMLIVKNRGRASETLDRSSMIRKSGHRFSLATNAKRLRGDHAQT